MGKNTISGKTKFFPDTKKPDVYTSNIYTTLIKPPKLKTKKLSDYKQFKIGRNRPFTTQNQNPN
jgi:hypothetical protein